MQLACYAVGKDFKNLVDVSWMRREVSGMLLLFAYELHDVSNAHSGWRSCRQRCAEQCHEKPILYGKEDYYV